MFGVFAVTSTANATGNANSLAVWNGRVFNVRSRVQATHEQMVEDVQLSTHIVLGEKHYTPALQQAQADLIGAVVRSRNLSQQFTVAWEFLNAESQAKTESLYQQFAAGQITAKDFLAATQGASHGESYAPILETIKALSGHLLGVNLTREEKAPVVEHGISAADPALVPPGFQMGGADYLERFAQAMQGHATEEQISNYFAAQCLTDDVIAYHLLEGYSQANDPLKFLVIGAFHTEYFDGTVNRLKVRDPSGSISVVQFIDAADFAENELLPLLHDSKYGDIADYVVFVNEPTVR